MNNMGNCQLSKYFDKKFCINLDRRPDRWDIVSDEFNKWGIKDVERVSAVDGKTVEQKKEIDFSEKIDELNQETDTLLEEIDKWQM